MNTTAWVMLASFVGAIALTLGLPWLIRKRRRS